MKNIWMLGALLVFAGCQPDVQESPVAPPVSVSKTDAEPETQPAVVTPTPQKEPVMIETAPQSVKPVQAKNVPEKAASEPEAAIAPPVVVATTISEPARVEKTAAIEAAPAAMPAQLSEADAMALAKRKNCFACHALDKKMVGPAWRAVAEKYRGDAGAQAALESKVRKGGKGNWGSMAMPPQPALSGEELAGLVQFVLQLR